MTIAIMQPYVFPYIGYFQLIQAADTFVFYDDVNFIKKGFIHRNNLLNGNQAQRFTIPCKGISQHKRINEVAVDIESKAIDKLLQTIEQAYQRAPYFHQVLPIVASVLKHRTHTLIADMAMDSILQVSRYLELDCTFKVSSKSFSESVSLSKSERLIDISKTAGADVYINAIGGKASYDPAIFKTQDLSLKFLKSDLVTYPQFGNEFVPWLSIIDVLMFNSVAQIKAYLKAYTLE